MVHLFRRDGTIYNQYTLGSGRCVWLEWENTSKSGASTLGLQQEGTGI